MLKKNGCINQVGGQIVQSHKKCVIMHLAGVVQAIGISENLMVPNHLFFAIYIFNFTIRDYRTLGPMSLDYSMKNNSILEINLTKVKKTAMF